MTSSTPIFIRNNPDHDTTEVVNCPYDWIPITHGIISLKQYAHYCAQSDGSPLCLGPGCAIYPCERVRDFSEGRI
jgi:hypothetical protein